MLECYSDYLIAQNHRATATGLAKLMKGHISHDKVSRFLRRQDFSSKDLWAYTKKALRHIDKENQSVLIIDDTILEKPYTKENSITCWHHDHAKGRHVKGINIVSCVLNQDNVSLPIAYEIVKKDLHYNANKTSRLKRRSKETKNERFRKLLDFAYKNKVKYQYVLSDSWFGSQKNMEHIHYKLGKKFILGLKSNRIICIEKGTGTEKPSYLQLKNADIVADRPYSIRLKGIDFPLTLLKKVFKNGNGSIGTLYLVSNDLTLDNDALYKLYQKRWRIEEYHKSIKQNVSVTKSPCWNENTQKNHIHMSLIGYCKLEELKIKQKLNHYALRNVLLLRANMAALAELKKLKRKAVA